MYNSINSNTNRHMTLENNNKYKVCNFFAVPGNRQALLGMPDIKLLHILTIGCNTVGTEREDKDANSSTSRHGTLDAGSEQHCATIAPERSFKGTNSNTYYYTNTGENSNLNDINAVTWMVKNNDIKYFLPSIVKKVIEEHVLKKTKQLQRDFKDVFNGIGCFDWTFSLQLKPDIKPYQALLRCVAFPLQKLFKEELERLQQQDFITPLGIEETAEWYKSFVLIPKPNGKVRLHIDPATLNQALIRSVNRGTTLNDIFQ